MCFMQEMQQENDSIWSYIMEVLLFDLYSYVFELDGVCLIDFGNVYVIWDVVNIFNYFIIFGGLVDQYKVNDVLYGMVSFWWYDLLGNDKKWRLLVYMFFGYESSLLFYLVLYLLYGIGGDEEVWLGLGRIVQIMDNFIVQGKVWLMIVVMFNGNVFQEVVLGYGSLGLV